MTGAKGRGGWAVAALLALACGKTTDFKKDSAGGAGSDASMPSASGDTGANVNAPGSGGAFAGASVEEGGESGSTSSGGTGNVTTPPLSVLKSSGCGKVAPAEQVATIPGSRSGYTEWTVNQTGATLGADQPSHAGSRQFFVRVPADYDSNHPYRVVYVTSGCGATHAGNTSTYPLFDEAKGGDEQAVYVGVSVPDNDANPGCYDNNAGALSQEWEAFDLMHTFVEQTYCVDNNQIYVAGYSSGAWVSSMWGCYFAGTPSPPLDQPDLDAGRTERKFAPHWAIRGHFGVTGSMPKNQPQPCNGPAAGLWIHDVTDKANPIEQNIAGFNLQLETNGCVGDYESGPKQPWQPAEQIPGLSGGVCQQYTGCPATVNEKYPLVFCTTSGFGHSDQAESAIPAFSALMQQLAPQP